MKATDMLLAIFNNPISRFVFGFIFCGSVAAPFLNGYSDNVFWLIAGIVLFILVLLSIFIKAIIDKLWIVYALAAIFMAMMVYLYFSQG